MDKGNVLVIGNSGVGKSTLINSILGEGRAETGWGTQGTTSELAIYENDHAPFRIIDSVGFEPSFFKRWRAINSVQRWSKHSVEDGAEREQINVIWFCVDGTSSKLFPDSIEALSRATRMWKSVPIIAVITKSYSKPERKNNEDMVRKAFASVKQKKNLRAIIPVVADSYAINDTMVVAPDGVTELIEKTNSLMPEGIQATRKDVAQYKLDRKRVLAQGFVAASTAAGAAAGAIPIALADAAVLGPLESAEISALARIYEIGDDAESKKFLNSILDIGFATVMAKGAVSALKTIPGINIGASVINAVVAGSIVFTLGEGAIYAFERVYLGEKTPADLDWVEEIMRANLTEDFVGKLEVAISKVGSSSKPQDIASAVIEVFSSGGRKKQEREKALGE